VATRRERKTWPYQPLLGRVTATSAGDSGNLGLGIKRRPHQVKLDAAFFVLHGGVSENGK